MIVQMAARKIGTLNLATMFFQASDDGRFYSDIA
jgi:hypothetical protein